MTTYARGNETSEALTEVRTVLSRAESALERLEHERASIGIKLPEYQLSWREHDADGYFTGDPDLAPMIGALNDVVRSLDRWRRTGRARRRR